MRPIETQEVKNARAKRNQRIVTILLLLILAASSLGYAFLTAEENDSGSVQDNGDREGFVGNLWQTYRQGQQLLFSNSPEQVKGIYAPIELSLQDYKNAGTVYIDSTNAGITSELQSTLGKYARLSEACYGSCERDVPEKNCSSAMIVWRESVDNAIRQEEKCVFIEGDLRAVDAFLFKVLGIS